MYHTHSGQVLLVALVFSVFLGACDSSTIENPTVTEPTFSTLSPTPSDTRVEQTFTIPENIIPSVFAQGETLAARNACGSRAMVLPGGTRVRVVEEDGVRRVFYQVKRVLSSGSDRANIASVGGDPDKGDGLINSLVGSSRSSSSLGSSATYFGETEFTCKCADGPQNQSTGCTPAINNETGHSYCDAYGDCNQCTMTTTVIGEG